MGQTEDTTWKKYDESVVAHRPRTAFAEASDIHKRARETNDFATLLKSLACMTTMQNQIDPDSISTYIGKMEELCTEYDKKAAAPATATALVKTQAAAVHAVLATAYSVAKDSYNFRSNEELKQRYTTAQKNHFSRSTDDFDALFATDASSFGALVTSGNDSRMFRHDMLSVLTQFRLEHDKVSDMDSLITLCNEVSKYYLAKDMKDAFILMRLAGLKCCDRVNPYYLRRDDASYSQYDSLLNLAYGLESEIDVVEALIAGHWRRNSYDYDSPKYTGVVEDNCIRILEGIISRHPDHPNTPHLKSYVAEIRKYAINIEFARDTTATSLRRNIVADKPFAVKVKVKNLPSARLEVRRYVGKENDELLLTGDLVQSFDCHFDYSVEARSRMAEGLNAYTDSTLLTSLPVGSYVFVCKTDTLVTAKFLNVSSMHMFAFENPDKRHVRTVVLDSGSGEPVPHAAVVNVNDDDTYDRMYEASSYGVADIPCTKGGMNLVAFRGKSFMTDCTDKIYYGGRYHRGDDSDEEDAMTVLWDAYTDRSIYRPGQTVRVSVLGYRQKGDDLSVASGETVTVVFVDAWGKQIAQSTVVTNAMGTADTSFKITRENCSLGRCSIKIGYNTIVSFSFEEYKRPTYDVSFEPLTDVMYALGDTVKLTAKAETFAGFPVQKAFCKCTIERAESGFFWWGAPDWEEYESELLSTDDMGQVCIPVHLNGGVLARRMRDLEDGDAPMRILFRVTLSVTDIAGETHEARYYMRVGSCQFALSADVSGTIDMAKNDSFTVKAFNADGNAVSAKGYYIFRQNGREVGNGQFESNTAIKFPAGLYGDVQLAAYALDDNGKEVRCETDLCLIDKRLYKRQLTPVKGWFKEDFFYSPATEYGEGKPIEFFMKPSSLQDGPVNVYYYINVDNTIVEEGAMHMSDGLLHVEHPYRKEYGKHTAVVHLFYVRDGHTFCTTQQYTYVLPDMSLNMAWQTMRDHTQPGAKEHWTLQLSDKKGKPLSGAELMATMYDASLDAFCPHSWSFSPSFVRRHLQFPYISHQYSFDGFMSLTQVVNRVDMVTRNYDFLTEYIRPAMYIKDCRLMRFAAAPSARSKHEAVNSLAAVVPDVSDALDVAEVSVTEEKVTAEDFDKASVRSDFAETAFFMPHVTTDKNGIAHIEFTVPESLTSWRFMALAHTPDMHYGKMTSQIVSRRPFVVQPNMPRFLRSGDAATIASRIINTTDEALSGSVRMRLISAADEHTVVYEKVQPFSVGTSQTCSVAFDVNADEDWISACGGAVICEIVAVSGDTSDGERNQLPLISTRQSVTETVPFYVDGVGQKSVSLRDIYNGDSQTATDRTFSVEYTDNPAWEVFKQLCCVDVPTSDNAPSLAAAVYSNYVLADMYYRLRKSVPDNDAAARAVLDSFNPDEALEKGQRCYKKLLELQLWSGAWRWFEGMDGSYYITLAVAEHLERLDAYFRRQQGGDSPVASPLRSDWPDKVVRFLDQYELDAYNAKRDYAKKHDMNFVCMPSESTMRYLGFVASHSDVAVSDSVRNMRKAYIAEIPMHMGELTMYGLAKATLLLKRSGKWADAQRFVTSLREHLVHRDGFGMYFATDAAYYSWQDYRVPTHTAAMRAFIVAGGSAKDELNEMQLWLLRQKQTQVWENPLNSVDVADLLLMVSPETTLHRSEIPSIDLDATPMELHSVAESHYVFMPKSPVATVSELTVSKKSEGVSWGYARATFMEDDVRLKAYTTGELDVQCLWLDEKGNHIDISSDGFVQGKKVVLRLLVTADRDMDFVSVKSQLPACLEPVRQLSGYKYMWGNYCYIEPHDSFASVFFEHLRKGSVTIDLDYYVVRSGTYHVGITTAECTYAPDFGAHTGSGVVKVEK